MYVLLHAWAWQIERGVRTVIFTGPKPCVTVESYLVNPNPCRMREWRGRRGKWEAAARVERVGVLTRRVG